MHTGDLVIDGMPVIDYDNGGSALDFDTVIPGHGRVLNRDDVKNYIPKVKTMNERMRELARKKVPDDQLAAQLEPDDLGWEKSVSTGTFLRSIVRYRDEIAAAH